MASFEEQLDQWCNEVAEQCNKYGQQIDLNYYVGQTPITHKPKYLIIGINPGGETSYKQAFDDRGGRHRTATELSHDLRPLILAEKPHSSVKKISSKFKELFNASNDFDILQDSVMINMIYFNTKGTKNLYKVPKEVQKYCYKKTRELIDVIDPEYILIMSSAFKQLSDFGVKDIKLSEFEIKTGTLDGRRVWCIPHYSARPKHYQSRNVPARASKLAQEFGRTKQTT